VADYRFYRFLVRGIVQGVGFRPYIYRKAKSLGAKGYVKNIGYGVEIVVNDKDFLDRLTDLPPLSKISGSEISEDISGRQFDDFLILESTNDYPEHGKETQIPADIFMCDDCLKELEDKNNRRHDYYFITCTNCGPRFSMIENYPYDRPFTSMDEFPMCEACRKEYTDPMDRRYHAQTIACKNCGPKLKLLHHASGRMENLAASDDSSTIESAADILKSEGVISIKGVGGFHLCSRVADVMKIRKILRRPDKAFALMVKDLSMLEGVAKFSGKEKELLLSPQRPIVVLKKNSPEDFIEVSELDTIGVMLAYTSLHYMLFNHIDEPLVMTSCNVPGEPVSTDERLAEYFLSHERRIVNRCDDSVLKVVDGQTMFLRRSRGYTPLPVNVPIFMKDTLALGAELNNVICAAKGNSAFLSQYIGETSKLETLNFAKEAVQKMKSLTRLRPKIVVCDMHPAYNTTILAKELASRYGAKLYQIQHHKAHVASVAAEHNLTDYIGIAMDGLGYGDDGKIWGGEIFDVRDGIEFRRIGHLEEQPQIGGDAAALNPKKMLFGILSRFLDGKELARLMQKLKMFDEKESRMYMNMLEQKFNTPMTTSSGRVLDAVSALLGICELRSYDGRPAMMLESFATTPITLEPVIIEDADSGTKILSTTALFKFLLENLDKYSAGELAATAQMYLAVGMHRIAQSSADGREIVFSGGVAYNRMMTGYMLGKGVLINKEIPAGDGGISYGQAYLANLMDMNLIDIIEKGKNYKTVDLLS